MAAITWRNVDGPSLGEASGILSEAGRSLNAGIGVFDKMLKQREAVQAANWEAGKTNNTQAYLDTLAAAKTPEELAALQQSGALDQMAAGFGGQVDREKLRGAAAAQLNTLRTQATATNQYNDAALARTEAPVNDEITMRIAQKDFAGAKELLLAKNLKNEGVHWNSLNIAERQVLDQKTNDELKGYQVTAARNQAADTELARANSAEDRAIQTDAMNYSSIVGKQQRELGMSLGAIATRKGYPVDSSGMVDMESLNPAQRADLVAEGKKAGLDANSFGVGDTKAFTGFMDSIRTNGTYSPEAIARNLDTIKGRFNTAKTGAPIGNDAYGIAVATAKNDVGYAEQDAGSWYAPGSPDGRKAYEAIATKAATLVDPGNLRDVNKALYDIASEGITLKNGKKIVPSENDVMAAIRSTKDSWGPDMIFGGHGDNLKNELVRMLSTDEAQKRIIEGEKSANYRRKQAVIQKLTGAK